MPATRLLSVAGLTIVLNYPALGAPSEKLTTVHAFTGKPDGAQPQANLLIRRNMLYGTTAFGGASGDGAIFKVDPKSGAEKIVYSFMGGTDGVSPLAGLVAHDGLLYGTTFVGGSPEAGTVFKFDVQTGAETVLYSFTGQPDGIGPEAGVIYHNGFLYGTTFGGGTAGNGTLFAVNAATGAETVLHSFTGGPCCGGTSDAGLPLAAPIYKDGILYGTTEYGGSYSAGAVYSFNLTTGTEAVMYSFGGGSDGGHPYAALVYQGGRLWGTASSGGSGLNGTLFQIDPATNAETTIYSFTGEPDGSEPHDSLIFERGAFYGTTLGGGSQNQGTVFKFNKKTSIESTLYSFTATNDGAEPGAGLVYLSGILYGTTPYAGASQWGTVFKLAR